LVCGTALKMRFADIFEISSPRHENQHRHRNEDADHPDRRRGPRAAAVFGASVFLAVGRVDQGRLGRAVHLRLHLDGGGR
jgi:hypothetical protein